VTESSGGLKALFRVACATTLMVLSFSLITPVLAVRLQTAGESASAIGLFAMLPFLSIALMVPLMPWVFDRLGVVMAYRCGLVLEGLGIVGYALTDNYALWCALAIMGGIGAAAAWNGTEAMLVHNLPQERRGRLTGLYQTALGAATALGPFLPGLLLLSPRVLTLLAAAMPAVGLMITLGPRVGALRASHADAVPAGLWATMCGVPGLVAVAFVGGVFDAGLGSITAAYGSQSGLSLAAASSVAGMLGVGGFCLQYPCGWLSDHVSPRRVFALAGGLLLAASLTLLLVPAWLPLLWACAFVWGAVGSVLYTLTMIRVAHEFAASSAITGTAAMITGYTAGGAIGPSFSGLMFDVFGVAGQSAWLSVLSVAVLLVSRRFSSGIGYGVSGSVRNSPAA
jgi:MFS family permease